MAKYQVAIVHRPEVWDPESADDVPLELSGPVGFLLESDDLFDAVAKAIEHNESVEARQRRRWAIVTEPGSAGRVWPSARFCTPIVYQVLPIWWPDGWEPQSPLDVPNCLWQSHPLNDVRSFSYPRAEATMLALNRQCMEQPDKTWYIVVGVENEPISRSVSCDSTGTETIVEVRGTHAIRSEKGGHGDCSRCPAGSLACATANWRSQTQVIRATRRRSALSG